MSFTPEKAEILGALFGDKSLFGFIRDMDIIRELIVPVINEALLAYPSEKIKRGASVFLT